MLWRTKKRQQTTQVHSQMTEKKCPSCEGTNIAEIMYGYPSSEFLDELKKEENKGKYQLGGCCISNDDPAFSCNDCGFQFGNREEEDEDGALG